MANTDYDSLFRGEFRKFVSGGTLKLQLERRSLRTHKCSTCGIGEEWNGKLLVLQIDHRDGDNTNNAVSNLREICPNCHSQTPTFSGKNSSHAGTAVDKPRKYGDRHQYLSAVRQKFLDKNKDIINSLRSSDIDFTKFGWIEEASKIINVRPQKVRPWMEKCCPELLVKAFDRQRTTGSRRTSGRARL